ncbi:ATP-binding protein [Sporosarcina sp. FA9]|uniref:ATP-binding protein n=1 Tax=Sporosarcina sp. FA9 TaxID=3413030 RepID=UPI003F6594A0
MRNVQEVDIWTMLGNPTQENLFFKARPEMISTVSEVRMDKVECPSCKDKTLDAWIYKQSGDWLQEKVLPICGDCQKIAFASQVGNSIKSKHQKVVDKDWYLISDNDDAGFKNFEAESTETTAAKTKAIDFTKSIIAGEIKNLRLSGTTGTGKTHLSKAIARTLKHEGKSISYIGANELFNNIKSMFGNDHARERFDKQFSGFEVMIIDDVGVETSKANEVSWSSSEWVRLIDMREGKSTVYTTNFDEKSLAGVIGARAESRMSQNAESIKLYTPDKDYRKLFY